MFCRCNLWNYWQFLLQRMGGTQSTEVPGGGTEGYHVLRVKSPNFALIVNTNLYSSEKYIAVLAILTFIHAWAVYTRLCDLPQYVHIEKFGSDFSPNYRKYWLLSFKARRIIQNYVEVSCPNCISKAKGSQQNSNASVDVCAKTLDLHTIDKYKVDQIPLIHKVLIWSCTRFHKIYMALVQKIVYM